jgi:hypothetical protein
MFFYSHESSFRVPYDCYMMVAHRVLGLALGHAFDVQKCPRCNESPPGALRGFSSSTTSCSSMSGEQMPISMLMDHIPRCPRSYYLIRLHDRIVNVLDEFMAEAGAIKRRDLRSEARQIRCGASSRDHPRDVGSLDFAAPKKHLVVDVTVTRAHTNFNVSHDAFKPFKRVRFATHSAALRTCPRVRTDRKKIGRRPSTTIPETI